MFLQKNDLNYSDMAREQRKAKEIMQLFHQQDDNSLVIKEFKVPDDLLLCNTVPPPNIPGGLFLKTTA